MIADVNSFADLESLRDPVEPVQPHDVIHTQQLCVLHVVPQAVYKVPVAAEPGPFRMRRRETPVLPLREKPVGRDAARDAASKQVRVAPDVKPARVDTQGKVEIETRTRSPGLRRHLSHLRISGPLHVEVVEARGLVIIFGPQLAPPLGLGPMGPSRRSSLGRRPKAGIGLELWARRDIANEILVTARSPISNRLIPDPQPPNRRGQFLKHPPLQRHQPAIVHQPGRP